MGKVTKLDDYRVSKYDRAVKKQKKDNLLKRMSKFLKKAEVFFDKANSERGKRMIKDSENDNK